MGVEFHPEAQLEFLAAHAWLEAERTGLGDSLAASVGMIADRMVRHPHMGPPVRMVRRPSEVRQVLVHRFQYLVLYRVQGEVIQIVAVAHTRRRPGYWPVRLH